MRNWTVEAVARVPALLGGVAHMAEAYPHPHEVFGRPGATDYVLALATLRLSGWYAVSSGNEIAAAAHLGAHGYGHGYVLWTVRHLLARESSGNALYWRLLFDSLAREARQLKPGLAKLVVLLEAHETEAASVARQAGFSCEDDSSDLSRAAWQCLVLGRAL